MVSALRTDRLILKPRSLDDIDDCIAMDQDPMVTKFVDGPWDNLDAHRSFLMARMSQDYPNSFGYWSIFLIDDPASYIGWVMMIPEEPVGNSNPADTPIKRAEIGWRLTRKSWGQGIATEAATKLVATFRAAITNTQIFASIHPQNVASIRVAEKIGMRFTHAQMRDGQVENFYRLEN